MFRGGFFLFYRRSEKPPFFGAKNQKSAFSAGVEGAIFFEAQAEKPRLFFFFRRRLVMVFGGQMAFSTPPKYFAAPKNISRRLFSFFLGAPKNRRFSAPKNQKSAFSAGVEGAIFFGAQAEKPRFFFFFFGAASLWCSVAKLLF